MKGWNAGDSCWTSSLNHNSFILDANTNNNANACIKATTYSACRAACEDAGVSCDNDFNRGLGGAIPKFTHVKFDFKNQDQELHYNKLYAWKFNFLNPTVYQPEDYLPLWDIQVLGVTTGSINDKNFQKKFTTFPLEKFHNVSLHTNAEAYSYMCNSVNSCAARLSNSYKNEARIGIHFSPFKQIPKGGRVEVDIPQNYEIIEEFLRCEIWETFPFDPILKYSWKKWLPADVKCTISKSDGGQLFVNDYGGYKKTIFAKNSKIIFHFTSGTKGMDSLKAMFRLEFTVFTPVFDLQPKSPQANRFQVKGYSSEVDLKGVSSRWIEGFQLYTPLKFFNAYVTSVTGNELVTIYFEAHLAFNLQRHDYFTLSGPPGYPMSDWCDGYNWFTGESNGVMRLTRKAILQDLTEIFFTRDDMKLQKEFSCSGSKHLVRLDKLRSSAMVEKQAQTNSTDDIAWLTTMPLTFAADIRNPMVNEWWSEFGQAWKLTTYSHRRFRNRVYRTCKSDICGDKNNDCCADPNDGTDSKICTEAGYSPADGGQSTFSGPNGETCEQTYGENAVFQCCDFSESGKNLTAIDDGPEEVYGMFDYAAKMSTKTVKSWTVIPQFQEPAVRLTGMQRGAGVKTKLEFEFRVPILGNRLYLYSDPYIRMQDILVCEVETRNVLTGERVLERRTPFKELDLSLTGERDNIKYGILAVESLSLPGNYTQTFLRLIDVVFPFRSMQFQFYLQSFLFDELTNELTFPMFNLPGQIQFQEFNIDSLYYEYYNNQRALEDFYL